MRWLLPPSLTMSVAETNSPSPASVSESAAGIQPPVSGERPRPLLGVELPADCRITSHGSNALSLRVFIKQPRAGSLEKDIVRQLGGAHHVAAALVPPQATNAPLFLPYCSLKTSIQQC